MRESVSERVSATINQISSTHHCHGVIVQFVRLRCQCTTGSGKQLFHRCHDFSLWRVKESERRMQMGTRVSVKVRAIDIFGVGVIVMMELNLVTKIIRNIEMFHSQRG